MRHPDVDEVKRPEEIADWYWTREQLNSIARRMGVSRSGSKQDVADRLLAHLRGEPFDAVASSRRSSSGPKIALSDINPDLPIPPGQRMDAVLRAWMVEQVGPSFRFDGHMRDFLSNADGATFGDLADHWSATRDLPRAVGDQFEYNAFTRAFHEAHPGASRADVLAAWREYVATPVWKRPPITP